MKIVFVALLAPFGKLEAKMRQKWLNKGKLSF
jgi:hypothetical protein